MSLKTCKIKLFGIFDEVVMMRKDATARDAISFFEREDGREADALRIISLTDKSGADKKAPTWAQIVEETDFEPEELPMFL